MTRRRLSCGSWRRRAPTFVVEWQTSGTRIAVYKSFGSTPMLPATPSTHDVTADEYQHRGYRAVFYRHGEGWRVEIYPPGSNTCELVVSYSGAEPERDILIDDITQLIDRRLDLMYTPDEGETAS